jgi:cardiolipin synthase
MIPRKTDGWFVEWGSRSYLREAQEAGIQILLYEPRFLHAKMLVCDNQISTCGSTNIDFRSFLNNFEANTFVYDETVAKQMKHIFLHDAELSTPLTNLPRRIHPSFFARLGESIMRLLSPLL